MVRMHISRIYMDIHACFLMRSCTVFFFPPSSMLVGVNDGKLKEKRRQHSCFGHHMLYLHNVLRWDLTLYMGISFCEENLFLLLHAVLAMAT